MEWDRETPWRQGFLLQDDTIKQLSLSDSVNDENKVVVMVASHDCDLAQTPNNEPLVEVLVGLLIPEPNGNCTHAKNSRKLHIELRPGVWAEFEATSKNSVCKILLNEHVPDLRSTLTPENHTTLQMWLASRYRRSAFPDEFERRLTDKSFKLDEKISKTLKPLGALIVGIFFDVDDGIETCRSGADDTYTLDITILHTSAPDVFEKAESAANDAVAAIEKAFKEKLLKQGKWQNIELRYCIAVSEDVLTYADFKRLKRWRLDHISLAPTPQQILVAE